MIYEFCRVGLSFLFKLFFLISSLSMLNVCSGQEKKIVIIIPSFNNRDWYQKNLDAVFSQEYENYRLIYIDDCSSDGTGDLVARYIKERGVEDRITLIRNKTRKRALANLYYAIHYCDDDEIVLTYDGDDWLAHNRVFSLINDIYTENSDVWITYGQFKNWPIEKIGYSRKIPSDIVEKKLYRKSLWVPGQLRTFYAWLFKQIKLEDLVFDKTESLQFQGYYFPANYDLAICYPMIEMAGNHYKFVSEVIYIHNTATLLNDFKVNRILQKEGASQIVNQPEYERLDTPVTGYLNRFTNSKADLIIFAFHSSNYLKQLLDSVEQYIHGIGNLLVVAEWEKIEEYKKIIDEYKAVQFAECATMNNPGKQIADFLFSSQNEHVLVTSDNMVVERYVDCNRCIRILEQTFAYTFFLAVGKTMQGELPPLIDIEYGVFGWRFCYAKDTWRQQHGCAMGIYRKQDILKKITTIHAQSLQELITAWIHMGIDNKKLGLCFDIPRVSCRN